MQDALSMLFLADAYPWPLDNGAIQRSYHLLESFATRFRVTLVARRRGGAAGAERTPLHDLGVRVVIVDNSDVLDRPEGPYGLWRPVGQQLRDLVAPGQPIIVRRWWSDDLLARLRELYTAEHHDVVWALRAPLAEMALEAGWPASRILVDLVDLESEAVGRALAPLGWYAKRPLHNLDLKRLERYERSLPARFGHVVVCKSDDRTVLGTPPNASVVPNGVNLQPAVDSSHADANEMLFVGSMGYDPNADAVKWFMRDIMPEILRQHPPARLAVVGKEVGADVQRLHDGHSCIIHGAVPEVAPFYAAAGLVVVPIRLGAGTRLKVLEALMLGKPIVATRMAVEGIDITSGEHYEAADSEADFARICVELMRDATRRQRLAEAGRQRVIELYQWSRIGNLAADVADNVGRREAAPVSSVAG